MEIALGFLDNPDHILVRRFSLSKQYVDEESISLEEIYKCNLNGLFLSNTELEEGHLKILQDELDYIPIKKIDELSFDEFKLMNPLNAIGKLKYLNQNWILRNNLILVENIFEIAGGFKKMLHNDRDLFFIELWQKIKSNLGAIDLVFYFNDLEKEKNKISKKKIIGTRNPEILEISEVDSQIIKTFEYPSETILFSKEKEELIISMDVSGSPLLIIGRCFAFGPLQNALIRSFFRGIN